MEMNDLIVKEKVNFLLNFNINAISLDKNAIFLRKKYKKCSVKDYILKYTDSFEEKILDSFKMVKLNDNILDKDISKISDSEKIKIELAIQLLKNVNTLFFYQFDKFFMEKDLLYFKKLLRKLVIKYHKTIVMIDCRFSFALDFADKVIYLDDKNKAVIVDKYDFYNEKLLRMIDIPDIIDFVKYVNRNEKILNEYTDIKELIKAIYREV
jgi:energy-coupling factor transporter ATP-binding protein EcfA2